MMFGSNFFVLFCFFFIDPGTCCTQFVCWLAIFFSFSLFTNAIIIIQNVQITYHHHQHHIHNGLVVWLMYNENWIKIITKIWLIKPHFFFVQKPEEFKFIIFFCFFLFLDFWSSNWTIFDKQIKFLPIERKKNI